MSNVLTTGPTLPTRLPSSDESPPSIRQPENDVLRQINVELALTADLADITNDLSQTRNKLYTEMTRLSRFQHQVSRGVEHIQKLEVRFQRFTGLMVDIGIPYFTVQRISDALDSDFGTVAYHMMVDAIGEAIHDPETLLSSLKPVVVGQRAPGLYQSALYRTPSVRRKARAQKKITKFRKCLAPEDDHHAESVTASSSNTSFTREPLNHTCQPAVDALIARTANADSDRLVFPAVQDGLILAAPASGFVSDATSASGSTVRLQHPVHTFSPSNERFSISELRISRRRAFLGNTNLNIPQSPIRSPETDAESGQQNGCEEQSARPSVTLGRDLIEVRQINNKSTFRNVIKLWRHRIWTVSPLVTNIAIAPQRHQGQAFRSPSRLLLSPSVPPSCLRPLVTLSPINRSTIPHSTACFMVPTVLRRTQMRTNTLMDVQALGGTCDSSSTSTTTRDLLLSVIL